MTIGEMLGVQASKLSGEKNSPVNPEQAAKNREILEAIKTINEGGGVGPSSELRFALDRDSGRVLIRIVDRVTDEVLMQLPPESALRTAEMIKSLKPGERIA